jgi:hypothetical protein
VILVFVVIYAGDPRNHYAFLYDLVFSCKVFRTLVLSLLVFLNHITLFSISHVYVVAPRKNRYVDHARGISGERGMEIIFSKISLKFTEFR